MFCKYSAASLIILFFTESMLISCKSTPTAPSYNHDDLTGHWIIDRIHLKGSINIFDTTIILDSTILVFGNTSFINFHDNKTYCLTIDGASMGKNSNLIMGLPDAVSDTGTWSLSEASLAMTSFKDDTTIVFQTLMTRYSLTMKLPIKNGTSVDITETFTLTKE